MRITEQGEKQRLDGLSFANTFPEDYLPYSSSYHRKAPYLVWEDNATTHRKYMRRKCLRACTKSCSWSTAIITIVFTVGMVVLLGAVAISVYLGWLTHTRSPIGLSLTGKLRVLDGDQFSPSLLNTSSEEFRKQAAKYENMLQSVYSLSKLKNSLTKVEVYAFHEGSLEVYFNLHLHNTKHENLRNLTTIAKHILVEEAHNSKSSVFQGIRVDTLSIQLLDPNEPAQEESKAETSAVKYNIQETSTLSTPEYNKTSHNDTSEGFGNSATTPSSHKLISHHSHQISNSTFMFNYGPWRPLLTTEASQATDRIITPPPVRNFHSMYDPRNTEFRSSTFHPRPEIVFASNSQMITISKSPKTTTVKLKATTRPLRQNGVILQSPSLRLLDSNATRSSKPNNSTSIRKTVSLINSNNSANDLKTTINTELENVKNVSNPSEHPQTTVNNSSFLVEETRNSNITSVDIGVPLTIRGSSHVQSNTVRKVKVGHVELETSVVATQKNESLGLPITANSPTLYLRNNKDLASGHNTSSGIELPAEASLKFKPTIATRSPIYVGSVSVEENKQNAQHKKDQITSVVSGGISSVISDKDQEVKRPKLDTSTELTIGASLFIRSSKQNEKPGARPNLPITVSKLSNHTENATPNRATMHLFQEPVLTPQIFIRGSSKGSSYISLSSPNTSSEHNKRPLNIINNNQSIFLTEETVRTSKHLRFINGSSDGNEQNPVGKIISQFIPAKGDKVKSLQNHNNRDETKDRHQTSNNKYNRPNLAIPEKHKKTYTPVVQESTTETYRSSLLPENTNDIQDYLDTTTKQQATLPTTSLYNGIVNESAGDIAKKCEPSEEFTCISGSCIPLFRICDRQKDCPDASDEVNCSCSDYMRSRVFKSKLCDGVVDCWDYSDEINCAWCSVEQFICPGAKMCYPKSKVCDGYPDCPGGEDELNCVKLVQNMVETNDNVYKTEGYVAIRKDGEWGKLCMNNFPISLDDVGKAVCNSMHYRGIIFAKKAEDNLQLSQDTYYQFGNSLKPSLYNLQGTSLLSHTDCPSKEVLHLSCKSLECGLQPLTSTFRRRIVGGFGASFGSWPWQVALYKEGDFQCGAVIINERWLISAGHCFYHSMGAHWAARVGLLRRGSEIPSPYEQIHNITNIFLHPLYVDRGFINDIALLRVEKEIQFSDQIRPICLPENAEFKSWEGQMCTVIGWGKLFEVGRIFPDTLQEVQLPLISTEECRKRTLFLPLYKITDNMFCAGFDRGGRDACLGDSGGPFMCQQPDGRWTLIGVTSNGDGCGRPGRPGVYTKIVNYLEWIQSVIGNNVIPVIPTNTCQGHRCLLGRCLPNEKVCDGVMDCWDDSDEKNCQV